MLAAATLESAAQVNEVLAHHTGQPLSKITHDTDRDYILGPVDAKEYGLIDEILEVRDPTKAGKNDK